MTVNGKSDVGKKMQTTNFSFKKTGIRMYTLYTVLLVKFWTRLLQANADPLVEQRITLGEPGNSQSRRSCFGQGNSPRPRQSNMSSLLLLLLLLLLLHIVLVNISFKEIIHVIHVLSHPFDVCVCVLFLFFFVFLGVWVWSMEFTREKRAKKSIPSPTSKVTVIPLSPNIPQHPVSLAPPLVSRKVSKLNFPYPNIPPGK